MDFFFLRKVSIQLEMMKYGKTVAIFSLVTHIESPLSVARNLVCAAPGRFNSCSPASPGSWNRDIDVVLSLFAHFHLSVLLHISHPNSFNFLPIPLFPGDLLSIFKFSPEAKGSPEY